MDDMSRISPEMAAQMMTQMVNNAGRTDMLTFAATVNEAHRSVQHQTMKLFLYVIHTWAECYDKGHYDSRNVAVCKLAKKIITDNPNIFSSGDEGYPLI